MSKHGLLLCVLVSVVLQAVFAVLLSGSRAMAADDPARTGAAVTRCQVEDQGVAVVGYGKVVCIDPKAIKWIR